MTTQESRDSMYKETLKELEAEYTEVKKEYEKLRVREYLLNLAISTLKHLLEPSDACTFHLLSKNEIRLKK